MTSRLAALSLSLLALQGCATAAPTPAPDHAIRTVAPGRLDVTTEAGRGTLAVYVSRDWDQPQPDVTRAIVLFHGLRGRDSFIGLGSELAAGEAGAGSIVIAPQFLTEEDAKVHGLPDGVLRWRFSAASAGAPAVGPAAISSFEVLDAILARLTDRARFPRLARVVVAGHSAGAQLVQRYAVVGRGPRLVGPGTSVRYVVASPSSYLYLSEDRPARAGGFQPFDRTRCEGFNRWKYGLEGAPRYVGPLRDLERAYAEREVIYLLATADDDPSDASMDQRCEAEAQGPDRFARGRAYMRYLSARHPAGLNHHLWEVPGVAHSTRQVFTSPCGLAALLDRTPCEAR